MAFRPEIQLLGELSVVRAKQPLVLPASKKTRALLGYLAVTGRAHTREELCELLWQGPDDPRAALRWSLTKLRGVLGAEAIQADRERIALGEAETDLGRVRATLRAGVEHVSLPELEHAASCFRGELLDGLSLPDCYRFHEWSTAERDSARALRVAVLTALIERSAADPERALTWARQRVGIDPLSEAAHISVIGLLGELGRKRDAQQQFDTCARILEQELGARPSAALLAAKMRASASAVAAVAQPALQTEPLPTTAPALVGRESERELIQRSLAGESLPLLLFLGEPGIGKSRLLDELASLTRAAGGVVLAGRAFEAEMVRPYGPWIDALSSLDETLVPETLREELASLMPVFRDRATVLQNRSSLFDAVVSLVEHLASRSQVLAIALDDLQWFDEATVALLHYVTRVLGGKRVVIACGARPGELSDNANALALVRMLTRSGRAQILTLGPLSAEALTELARSVAPGVDAGRVARECSGNPLFALELTRAMDRGDDSAWDSVSGLIGERIARFDEPTKELLAWAAALGRRFELTTLERVTGVAPLEIGTRLAELERHGVLRASEDGRGYDFVHDLVRVGAYRQLSEPRRRGVHRNIARALDALDGPDAEHAGDIAHHAVLGGASELAVRASLAGAQRCLRVFAGPEAARLVHSGLQQLTNLPKRDQARARLPLLTVLVYAGPHSAALEAELKRAVAEAEELGVTADVPRALQAISQMEYDAGDLGAAQKTTLRAAEAGKASEPLTRAVHLANAARCLAIIERDVDQANAMYGEARKLARTANSRLMAVEWAGAILHAFGGDVAESRELFEHVLAVARAEEDRWAEYECLRALVQLELESEPSAEASRAPELLGVAVRMNKGSEEAVARALNALREFHHAKPGSHEALESAVVALREVDAKGMLAYTLTLAAEIDLDCDRVDDAERRAQEALTAARAVGRRSQMALALVVLARVALARGHEEQARAHFSTSEADCSNVRLSARARSALAGLSELIGV